MKLYTRTGDSGQTSLIGGRVRKDDARVEAYGTIDELNSFVGQAAAEAAKHAELTEMAGWLIDIQQELFDCGSDLAYAARGCSAQNSCGACCAIRRLDRSIYCGGA